jgi:integrase
MDHPSSPLEKWSSSRGAPLAAGCQSSEIIAAIFNSDWVFTTTGKGPISGFGRMKRRLYAAAGTPNWRIHDIRRTVASGMARIGIDPHVIEKVLNHKSGIISGVAAVYNRYGYEKEKRRALDEWAKHAQELRGPAAQSWTHSGRRYASTLNNAGS